MGMDFHEVSRLIRSGEMTFSAFVAKYGTVAGCRYLAWKRRALDEQERALAQVKDEIYRRPA